MKVGSAWIKVHKKPENIVFIVKYDKNIKQMHNQNNILVLFKPNKITLSKTDNQNV